MSVTTDRRATTSVPINDLLAERWSPRAYDSSAELTDAQFDALLEAARWAPSAYNAQPRRFIAARRGTPEFTSIVEALVPFNAAWAKNASALIVAIAVTVTDEGKTNALADYDLGQSIAHLSIQAHAEGLHVHQMSGLDPATLVKNFDLPAELAPLTVTAVGSIGDSAVLDEATRSRETAERARLPLNDLVLIRA